MKLPPVGLQRFEFVKKWLEVSDDLEQDEEIKAQPELRSPALVELLVTKPRNMRRRVIELWKRLHAVFAGMLNDIWGHSDTRDFVRDVLRRFVANNLDRQSDVLETVEPLEKLRQDMGTSVAEGTVLWMVELGPGSGTDEVAEVVLSDRLDTLLASERALLAGTDDEQLLFLLKHTEKRLAGFETSAMEDPRGAHVRAQRSVGPLVVVVEAREVQAVRRTAVLAARAARERERQCVVFLPGCHGVPLDPATPSGALALLLFFAHSQLRSDELLSDHVVQWLACATDVHGCDVLVVAHSLEGWPAANCAEWAERFDARLHALTVEDCGHPNGFVSVRRIEE